MAADPTTQTFASKAAATRRARELAGRLIALERTMADVALQRDEAVEELKGAERRAEQYRLWWLEQKNGRDKAEAEAAEARLFRDRFRDQAAADREARLSAEVQRGREQGYIEGLLDGMHPQRPQLPWELAAHDVVIDR